MEIGGVTLFFAFAAGLVSVLSPCVLPLVPIYLAYLTGSTAEVAEKRRPSHRRTVSLTGIYGRLLAGADRVRRLRRSRRLRSAGSSRSPNEGGRDRDDRHGPAYGARLPHFRARSGIHGAAQRVLPHRLRPIVLGRRRRFGGLVPVHRPDARCDLGARIDLRHGAARDAAARRLRARLQACRSSPPVWLSAASSVS